MDSDRWWQNRATILTPPRNPVIVFSYFIQDRRPIAEHTARACYAEHGKVRWACLPLTIFLIILPLAPIMPGQSIAVRVRKVFVHVLLGLLAVLTSSCARLGALPSQFAVRDFGAVPDDGRPDGPAIRKCLKAALAAGRPAEVVFEAGDYCIGTEDGAREFDMDVCLSIKNAANLTLRGVRGRTRLLFTNPSASGIHFERCTGVTVTDLVIDYDPLPYAQGTIRAVDAKNSTFDLEIDEGYLAFDHPAYARAKRLSGLWGMVIRPDAEGGIVHYGPVAIGADSFQPLGGRVWRLAMSGSEFVGHNDTIVQSGMKPGDRYVHLARTWGNALAIYRCEGFSVQGVTVQASPALAFFPHLSRDVIIEDCHVRRVGSRLISTDADGIHARGMRGGLRVERCSFQGMADDAINVHSSPIVVLRVISPREVIVRPHTWSVRRRDQLLVVDGKSLQERGRATVTASVSDGEGMRIEFSQSVEGMTAGSDYKDADRLYNLSEAANPFVIRDCTFLAHRGRSILISGIGGLVAGNRFENNEGWAVVMDFGDSIWAEGPPARRITIEDNLIVGRGGTMPSILTRFLADTRQVRLFRDLIIRNNRFEDLGAPAVRLTGVVGAILENDRIESKRRGEDHVAAPVIELENCADVTISGLHVEDPGFGTDLLIDRLVDPGEKGVRLRPASTLRIVDERKSTPAR